mgnify:CR=1 FL=1
MTDDWWEMVSLRFAVKEFLNMLDETEEGEDGQQFHPIQIDCCRAWKLNKLDEVLLKLRELSSD